MKISELQLNSVIEITLLVKSCSLRRTKPPGNKPFLLMTLTDGVDDISANKWDHYDDFVPQPNMVFDLSVSVGEYNGSKQLTVRHMSLNTTVDAKEFLPKGPFDIADYEDKLLGLIDTINDPILRRLCCDVFEDTIEEWRVAPAAKTMHHAYLAGNLQHIVSTAIKAKALAKTIEGCNVDLCVAGALLHDIGKLGTYRFNMSVIEFTPNGQLFEHIVMGIQMLQPYMNEDNASRLVLLQHIIASHHGELEYGSPVTPKFLEALVVSFADNLDAKAQMYIEANAKASGPLTDKIYALGNTQMFTREYIDQLFE